MALKLHNLKTKGKNKPRVKGRGISAGLGKTAGRGRDGQKSRSGYSRRVGFEGGQNPLYRRVSKRGFTNINRIEYVTVNVESLNCFKDGDDVTREMMIESGVLKKKKLPLKVLGDGSLEKKLNIHADKFTKSAIEKIETLGGKAIFLKKAE